MFRRFRFRSLVLAALAVAFAAVASSSAIAQTTTFATPLDNVATQLAAPYTPGSGTITVRAGDGGKFGSPTSTAPVRISIAAATAYAQGQLSDPTKLATYLVAGRSGDTLTGLTLDSGTDQVFLAGDYAFVFVTAKAVTAIHTAVNTLGGQVYNVKHPLYGAKGDGTTDDTAAVQSAANALIAGGGGTLFFPPGTYLLNTVSGSPYAAIITFSGSFSAIKVEGRGATITTSKPADSALTNVDLFLFAGAFTSIRIDGLTFVSTHALTTTTTAAIDANGGSGNLLSGLLVHDCEFRGFSQAVTLVGCRSPRVHSCRFYSPSGRDSGTRNGTPNCGVRSYVTPGGAVVTNLAVDASEFDGAWTNNPGSPLDVSGNSHGSGWDNRTGLDGLVQGLARGFTITNNRIRNFSYEAIQLDYRGESTIYPSVIQGNTIDCTLAKGSAVNANYGIRCEDPCLISGNTITNATSAILSDGYDATPQSTPSGMVISGNVIQIADTPGIAGGTSGTTSISPIPGPPPWRYGIDVRQSTHVKIEHNTITFANGGATQAGLPNVGIWLTNVTGAEINGNHISVPSGVTGVSPYITGMIFDGPASLSLTSTGIWCANNSTLNCDYQFGFPVLSVVNIVLHTDTGSAAYTSGVPTYLTHLTGPISADLSPSFHQVATKTTTYFLTNADYTIYADATAGSFSVYVPASTTVTPGKCWRVKKTDATANAVIIAITGASGDLIDGAASVSITGQYDTLEIELSATAHSYGVF